MSDDRRTNSGPQEIVDALRYRADQAQHQGGWVDSTSEEAADLIESLRAEVEHLTNYARHHDTCPAVRQQTASGITVPESALPCECGFRSTT